MQYCLHKKNLEGGGFAKPKPPLFPDANGCHQQRAFRGALTDILSQKHVFASILRLADFEIRDLINTSDVADRIVYLIEVQIGKRLERSAI
ncbi:MAG: hypothetical protein OXC62_03110 [Aestuariivita sp.]|nr:hypothetical protein [Aestuariivita sp.]